MASTAGTLRRRALRIEQTGGYPLYMFTLAASEILQVADVSRISRDEAGKLIGYQRPHVRRHIQDILVYLNSDPPVIFPNPIIMALSSRAHFRSSRGPGTGDGLATAGFLDLPLAEDGKTKPAWIVDGQQRALALSNAHRTGFPVPVTAFVADSVTLQRDQFLRVNNTRPLPRGLVTELLPEVERPPAHLAVTKAPAAVCEVLNTDKKSPLYGMIKRASVTKDQPSRAVVNDTSVVQMIQESLTSTAGCLYPYRNVSSGDTDYDGILHALCTYWSAVRDTFPDAWGKPPDKSRLMHSAGVRAIGRLMDRVLGTIDPRQVNADAQIRRHLELVAPHCRWTSGRWEELGLRWNEVQAIHRHIQELSSHLIRIYLDARAQLR